MYEWKRRRSSLHAGVRRKPADAEGRRPAFDLRGRDRSAQEAKTQGGSVQAAMSDWQKVEGHLATPRGFRGAAAAAGIKKSEGALDLGLLFSEVEETSAAGVFTTNRVAAAPVIYSRAALRASHGRARAVVVNSGNANAATGRAGLNAAAETARAAAKLLGVPERQVLVCSTGV